MIQRNDVYNKFHLIFMSCILYLFTKDRQALYPHQKTLHKLQVHIIRNHLKQHLKLGK
jgi:hypothetical protein